MFFLKYPINIFSTNLSPIETKIYLQLLVAHFRFSKADYSLSFWMTDRDLADHANCSTRSVYLAKYNLMHRKLISFCRGKYNRTYYKIIPDIPD